MPEIYSSKQQNHALSNGTAVTNVAKLNQGTTVLPTLKDVAENNSKVLFQLKSVFPFDFFPTTITIDLQKVSINNKLFFFSKQILSIPITEIFVVECDTNILFASLRIKDKRYELEPVETGFLKKDEAHKARRLLQGLIAVHSQGLSMDGMTIDEIRSHLEQIGSTVPTSI